jgi:UNC-50 family
VSPLIFSRFLHHFSDVVQFFALPLVLGEGVVPLVLANTLYAAALSWYWYITHLGYRSLPFLSNSEVFLFPIAAIVLLYVVMIVGHFFAFGWNAARVMTRFYFL